LLNPLPARVAIDFGKAFQRLDGLTHVRDQKSSPAILDHFTARAQVHGNNWHARGIRFNQNQSEPFRDSVQVDYSARPREQSIFFRYANRPDIADVAIIDVRFDLVLKVGLILDNAGDNQAPAAPASNFDSQMDALIRVNTTKKD
jgi:hypothetical protein